MTCFPNDAWWQALNLSNQWVTCQSVWLHFYSSGSFCKKPVWIWSRTKMPQSIFFPLAPDDCIKLHVGQFPKMVPLSYCVDSNFVIKCVKRLLQKLMVRWVIPAGFHLTCFSVFVLKVCRSPPSHKPTLRLWPRNSRNGSYLLWEFNREMTISVSCRVVPCLRSSVYLQ